ncbi:MAG: hypothetical protein F6J93_00860 [Oscillatoria sp. SIO1A7]|nr:hypothetical protein [Oscillatoria sp. SIO1A7]
MWLIRLMALGNIKSNPVKRSRYKSVGAVPPGAPHTNRGNHGGIAPTEFVEQVEQLRGFDIGKRLPPVSPCCG